MLNPTKHENLKYNLLVVGADVLNILKKGASHLESVYEQIKITKNIDLGTYFDCITYLWLSEFIEFKESILYLKNNDTK